jgi:hypothetical protein
VGQSRMGPRKRAMTGKGELWKRVGEERTPWRRELDSFTRIASEILRPSVAACRGVAFVWAEEVKVVEGLRENTM